MFARRLCFWTGVVGVGILADVVAEAATERFPNSGFAKLIGYAHRGASK
jgi:hypothetical protein